jgi:hypothetical protein
MIMKIDLSQEGLGMIFKPYQEKTMRYLWELSGEGASSRDAWLAVNKGSIGRDEISRVSIMNFLNDMVDEGVLQFDEVTGKGGHRRIYRSEGGETGFKFHVAKLVLGKLISSFPDETQRAIK